MSTVATASAFAELLTIAMPWIRQAVAEDRDLTPEEQAEIRKAAHDRLDAAIADGDRLQRDAP
jgi:DNA-binding transcriptional regulator YdaS (Cro superfamily)